ncbi:MAG: metallophosphoesterase family protein, partial [Myxococcota bacterium]
LADIHANPYALDAVIADLAQRDVDEIIVGGDIVGRGPQGSAVVDRIAELGWHGVRGNHEDYLINFFREEVPDDWLTADIWSASRWMAAELGAGRIALLDALPFSTVSEALPQVRVVHGSPASNQEGLGTWTQPDVLRAHFDAVHEPVLVCAHTHRPLVERYDDGLIVNVGSVGLPFNGDTRAQYAIFSGDPGAPGVDVELLQVEYDRGLLLDAYEHTGFLEHGGLTSAMLQREVVHARPFLVPFLFWMQKLEREPTESEAQAFLDFYDPEVSMRQLIERFESVVELAQREGSSEE